MKGAMKSAIRCVVPHRGTPAEPGFSPDMTKEEAVAFLKREFVRTLEEELKATDCGWGPETYDIRFTD